MKEAAETGYPVLLKATGGGGGIGIYICHTPEEVKTNFAASVRHDYFNIQQYTRLQMVHRGYALNFKQKDIKLSCYCACQFVMSCCMTDWYGQEAQTYNTRNLHPDLLAGKEKPALEMLACLLRSMCSVLDT